MIDLGIVNDTFGLKKTQSVLSFLRIFFACAVIFVLIFQATDRYNEHTIFLSLVGKIAGSRKHHEE